MDFFDTPGTGTCVGVQLSHGWNQSRNSQCVGILLHKQAKQRTIMHARDCIKSPTGMVTHPSLNVSNQTIKQTMKIQLHNVFELVVRPDGAEEVIEFQMHFKSCIERPKPSGKLSQ